jgi:outer membrane murein-binding lipoprotein Lpp
LKVPGKVSPQSAIAATLIVFLLATTIGSRSAPMNLELTGGSVIKGDLLSWNGQQAVVKAEYGSLTFKREQLSQATLQRLDLLSGDPQKLVARIAELEATVESLRKDNGALRQQLQALKEQLQPLKQRLEAATRSQPAAPAITGGGASSANSFTSTTSTQTGLSYTISSTGKRHNSRCRYFGSGRPCGPNEGIPCKICGG